MTKILLTITHGFQARMLLRSSVSENLLAAGAELIVLSPNADEPYFRQEFDRPGIKLEKLAGRFSRLETNMINMRQYLLMNPSLGATLNYKNERYRRNSPARFFACRVANAFLGRIPALRRGYLAIEQSLYGGKEFDDVLSRHRPDLVVTGTPGYEPHDVHLLRAARRNGVQTATVMLSWDNLTSKGYMGAMPDHLLVWSDLMTDEAVQYHGFPRSNAIRSGAAQFDIYHGIRTSFDRLAWRRAHGVADDATLIVYGTINPAILPHEPNIVIQIVKAMRASRFGRKVHLWVRLHPQSIRGTFSAALQPYRDLAATDVTIEEPPVQSEKLAWDLPKDDALHLAQLLAAADVVSTPSSTLVIDAACAGTPIVNVLFDGEQSVTPGVSAQRFELYTHYRQILETGGIAVARSIDDFIRMVNEYAVNPSLHTEQRAAMIRQQLGTLDGLAGSRIAAILLELAKRQRAGNLASSER